MQAIGGTGAELKLTTILGGHLVVWSVLMSVVQGFLRAKII